MTKHSNNYFNIFPYDIIFICGNLLYGAFMSMPLLYLIIKNTNTEYFIRTHYFHITK